MKMTVKEFAEGSRNTKIKLLSARNGKVLCYRFCWDKNSSLEDREVLSFWAEFEVTKSTYGSNAKAIICAYVSDPS